MRNSRSCRGGPLRARLLLRVVVLGLVTLGAVRAGSAQDRFNVLEAASLDTSGALELFGTRTPRGPDPIPFRQVLGEALAQAQPPQFSLDSDFTKFTSQALAGRRMDDLFHAEPGVLSDFGRAALEALRVPAPESGSFTAALLRNAGYSIAADLYAAIPLDEDSPSQATRQQWVRILGLTDDLQEFMRSQARHPADRGVAADQFYGKLLGGLADSMAPDAPPLKRIYQETRRVMGTPDQALAAGINRFLAEYPRLTVTAVGTLLERHGLAAVLLGPEQLEKALGAAPVSRPRFVNLEPSSQLGRLLLEGDYALKGIPLDGSLREIAGYRTFPEWAQTRIDPADLGAVQTSRLWVALDGSQVEMRETADGKAVTFGTVRMRIESRSKGAGEDWSAEKVDERTQEYADMLTEHFDALAERVPALHQLREAAKVVALSKWIRGKGVEPRLDYVAAAYQPPEEVQGFLAMIPSFRDGRLFWGVLPSGGVDFDFEIVVTQDPTLTLDDLRRRFGGGDDGASLEGLRSRALEPHVERYREEVERTRELEERMERSGGDAQELLSGYRDGTAARQRRALQDAGSAAAAAARALAGIAEALPEASRGELMAALGSPAPQPSLAGAEALALRAAALAEGRPDATSLGAVLEGLVSWTQSLEALAREAPGRFQELLGAAPAARALLEKTWSARSALALHADLQTALQRLEQGSHDAATALATMREVHRHLASRLESLRLEAAPPSS